MTEPEATAELRDAERMKFFTDAVVAIAMTLLILPLLESVADAGREGLSTAEFLSEHDDQLISFGISFVVIASFWVSHERLFHRVAHWTGPLMALNIGWMATIVVLPIATAMTGSMDTDALQKVLYIGTMILSSLLMLAMNVVVARDVRIQEPDVEQGVGGIAAALALVTLFGLALLLALVSPLDYYAMFLLCLTGPLQAVYARLLAGRGPQAAP